MRVTVLQIDNRLSEDATQSTLSPNRGIFSDQVCPVWDAALRLSFTTENRIRVLSRGWKYDFRESGNAMQPPWWWKVFAIHDIFEQDSDPRDLLVMWMDTDALVTNCHIDGPVSLATSDPAACMWISPDAPPARSPFNAGCFLVRGSAAGRTLMRTWCSLYDPGVWHRVPQPLQMQTSTSVRVGIEKQARDQQNHWMFTSGQWAGDAFEQGAFSQHILPHAKRYGVQSLPYYVFNEVHCESPHAKSITVHMSGHFALLPCRFDQQRCVNRRLHWRPFFWKTIHFADEKKWCASMCLPAIVVLVILLLWWWCKSSSGQSQQM